MPASVVLLAGCAPALSRPHPARPAFTSQHADQLATLLEIEDRRDFRRDELARLAVAAHPEVRRRTALAIGRLREPKGSELLLHLLSDADTAVSATAAFALGLAGDTATVPVLAARLAAPGAAPTVRAEAAASLGRIGTSAGRAALERFLRSTPLNATHSGVVGEALLAIWRTPRGADLNPITRWAGVADPELRWRATYALARRPDPRATSVLLRLAEDADVRARAFAVRGLSAALADSSEVGAARASAVLRARSGDSNRGVRVNAIRALGTHVDPASVEALASLTRDPDPWIAATAADALGQIGVRAGAAEASLVQATSSTRALAVRLSAIAALARVSPGVAAHVAASFPSEREWRLRAAAAGAFAILGRTRSPEWLRLFRDRDSRVSASALEAALREAGDSVADLRGLLVEGAGSRDVAVRAAALGGLAKLRDPATLPLLLDAYARAEQDTVNDVALAVITALAALKRPGTASERAFLVRFPRPRDGLVHRQAIRELGSAVQQVWGDPFPLRLARPAGFYRSVVDRWVVPALQGGAQPRAWIDTDSGRIELELFAADAPLTVDSFARLAASGFFQGQVWPRVVPNFVLQGGDPRGDTGGGPGYAIRDEINRHRYATGTLGMALSGPDTGGSQWFATYSPQPHLDGTYTVFGSVTAGLHNAERVQVGDRLLQVTMSP